MVKAWGTHWKGQRVSEESILYNCNNPGEKLCGYGCDGVFLAGWDTIGWDFYDLGEKFATWGEIIGKHDICVSDFTWVEGSSIYSNGDCRERLC